MYMSLLSGLLSLLTTSRQYSRFPTSICTHLDILLVIEDTRLAKGLVESSLLAERVDLVAAGAALDVALVTSGRVHQIVHFP